MARSAAETIRARVEALLAERGDTQPVGEHDSLFFRGRLDSLAATHLMLMLEEVFDIDLADADFDVTQLDTISDITSIVGQRAAVV